MVYHLAHLQFGLRVIEFFMRYLFVFDLVEFMEALKPSLVVSRVAISDQSAKRFLSIGVNGNVRFNYFVDLRFVNVNVDDFRLLRITVYIARHAVIETHSDADEHITLFRIYVRPVVSVHAEESDVVPMIRRKSAKSK